MRLRVAAAVAVLASASLAARAADAPSPADTASALRAAAAAETSPALRRRCERAAARLDGIDTSFLDRAPAWFRSESAARALDAARGRAESSLAEALEALGADDHARAVGRASGALRAYAASRRIALAAVRREGRGRRWTTVFEDLPGALLSVWVGPGPAPEVWVTGAHDADGEQVLRLRGARWERLALSGAEDLWWADFVPGDGFWACGTNGTVLRIDPATGAAEDRSPPTDADLYGLWGASASEVWTVGVPTAEGSTLHRWDGAKWERVAVPESVEGAGLLKLWGRAADDVYACGTGGTLLHWDGASWSVVEPVALDGGAVGGDYLTVHGNAREVVSVGRVIGASVVEGRGGVLRERRLPGLTTSLAGVFVPPRGDPWAVGYYANVLRRRRGAWRAVRGAPVTSATDLHAVRIDAGGGVWIAGGDLSRGEAGVLLRYGAGAPTSEVAPGVK